MRGRPKRKEEEEEEECSRPRDEEGGNSNILNILFIQRLLFAPRGGLYTYVRTSRAVRPRKI